MFKKALNLIICKKSSKATFKDYVGTGRWGYKNSKYGSKGNVLRIYEEQKKKDRLIYPGE